MTPRRQAAYPRRHCPMRHPAGVLTVRSRFPSRFPSQVLWCLPDDRPADSQDAHRSPKRRRTRTAAPLASGGWSWGVLCPLVSTTGWQDTHIESIESPPHRLTCFLLLERAVIPNSPPPALPNSCPTFGPAAVKLSRPEPPAGARPHQSMRSESIRRADSSCSAATRPRRRGTTRQPRRAAAAPE